MAADCAGVQFVARNAKVIETLRVLRRLVGGEYQAPSSYSVFSIQTAVLGQSCAN